MYRALAHDGYTPGSRKSDISVTSLIGPPKITQLKKRYADQLEEDASDRVWSLLGQATHKVLELAGGEKEMTEKRLYKEIEGWTLSGQTDLYEVENGVLSDFKVTSVFSFLLGGKTEWEQQLNLNAMLWRDYGYEPKKLQIVAILRDWQSSKAEFEADYPKCAVHLVDIPIWDNEECIRFAAERIKLHQAAVEMPDDSIPACTPKERWAKPDTFAIKKNGNKRASKVFAFKEDAENALAEFGPGHSIETRSGGDTRCERYCPVNSFCHYYKAKQQNT